jgi:hypothetical protein
MIITAVAANMPNKPYVVLSLFPQMTHVRMVRITKVFSYKMDDDMYGSVHCANRMLIQNIARKGS